MKKDEAIRDWISNYIKSADIEDIRKGPEDITRKGVFVRNRVLGGVRGDYFVCKGSRIIEILEKALSPRYTIESRAVLDALDYMVVKARINQEGKQYRVWGIPLEGGTRRLKYDKITKRDKYDMAIIDVHQWIIHHYIEYNEIKSLREKPDDIECKGIIINKGLIAGKRGTYFVCEESAILRILLSIKELPGYLKRFSINTIYYLVGQISKKDIIDVKLRNGEFKRYKILAFPLPFDKQ